MTEDYHTKKASEIYGIPVEEVTPEQRRHAKAINFGRAYGMQPHWPKRWVKEYVNGTILHVVEEITPFTEEQFMYLLSGALEEKKMTRDILARPNTLSSYTITGAEIQDGDIYGYKIIAVIHGDSWAAYRGSTADKDEDIACNGDKIPYVAAQVLFPTLDACKKWRS
jgi:hypothetical protein